jgi:hypothetical protein
MSKQFSFFIHPDEESELLKLTVEKTGACFIPHYFTHHGIIKPLSLPLSPEIKKQEKLYLTLPEYLKELTPPNRKESLKNIIKKNPFSALDANSRFHFSANGPVIGYTRSLASTQTLTQGRLYAQTKFVRHKDDSTWEKRMETAYFEYPPPEYIRWVRKVLSLWKRNLELHERVYFSKRAWELFRKIKRVDDITFAFAHFLAFCIQNKAVQVNSIKR